MATKHNAIIADKSALVSLINPTEANHKRAVAEASRLQQERTTVVIGSDIFSETINLLGKKFGKSVAAEAAHALLKIDSQFVYVEITRELMQKAVAYFTNEKQSVSLTDCIVMALADSFATREIFGFDKQFEDAGYTRLQPDDPKREAA